MQWQFEELEKCLHNSNQFLDRVWSEMVNYLNAMATQHISAVWSEPITVGVLPWTSPIAARQLRHAGEVKQGRNSCPWLPLYGQ